MKLKKTDIKIALISLQKDNERVPPLGLVYLATYLRDVVGVSPNNIKIFDRNFFDVEREVENFSPHLVGITAMSVNYQQAIEFATSLKKRKNIQIIIGGVHISTLPSSFKKCFDVGVLGEGEEVLRDLINLYLKKESFLSEELKKIKGVIYFNKDRIETTSQRQTLELDGLPLIDFGFAHPNYFKKSDLPGIGKIGIKCYLTSSRGCPYRCVFCSTSRFWGKMRCHSPEYIARLVEKSIEDYGSNYIQVMDDLFTINAERMREIKNEFEKRNILKKIMGITSTARANLINDELCRAMKELKIKSVFFGLESGSEKILRYLKVGTASVELNKKAIILCRKYGFEVSGSLMYGSPSETIEDMKKTNEFIEFCMRQKGVHINSFITTPFPSTPFWDIAIKRGIVSDNMNFSLLNHQISNRPLLLDPDISFKEFKKVFLEGRKKLRILRLRLILDYLLNNPLTAIDLVLKEPRYYLARLIKQGFKE